MVGLSLRPHVYFPRWCLPAFEKSSSTNTAELVCFDNLDVFGFLRQAPLLQNIGLVGCNGEPRMSTVMIYQAITNGKTIWRSEDESYDSCHNEFLLGRVLQQHGLEGGYTHPSRNKQSQISSDERAS